MGEISTYVNALIVFLYRILNPSLPFIYPVYTPVEKPALKHQCLLYRDKKKTSFITPSGLLKHYIIIYVWNRVFKQPFLYLKCIYVINSVEGWSNYIERYYSWDYTLSLYNLTPFLSLITFYFIYNKKYSPYLYMRYLNTYI